MPEISRLPMRMNCERGLDLVSPIDRMPPGSFPYLFNARVLVEGRLDGRPGYVRYIGLSDSPNSIRRLNDPGFSYTPSGYTYVGGGGTKLYAGVPATYAAIDNGYSGNPLSLIPFRPDQSPGAWMYVYDQNKMVKVRPDGIVRAIGVVPPTKAPAIEYGIPALVEVDNGQTAAVWTAIGAASAPTDTDRTNASAPTIASILYNTGINGWCCINPSVGSSFWMGERMQVILSGGNEVVTVRNILNAITSTVALEIRYDAGLTGACSVVLQGSPTGLARNSLIQINGEIVRVLEVIQSPSGVGYSLRCNTQVNHVAGEPVVGLISWYCYTVATHAAGESITSSYVAVTQAAAGVGAITQATNIDVSSANGRPISQSDDYLHISLFLQNPQNVDNVQILLSLDPTPNFSFINPGNTLIFTIPASQLNTAGSSSGSWVEIVVPISSATRTGIDLTRTLANVTGLAIQLTSIAACNWGFDWWGLFGTYGSVVQPNSPVGTVYQYRYRDSSTGAHSVPGPQNRYQLFPLREAVIITPAISTQAGVDTLDIYRQGASITSPLYVGSVANILMASYLDALPDLSVLETNQPPDLTSIQPWPTLALPWQGVVTVVGTTVTLISGTRFNVAALNNTAILINGVAYLTYGPPTSDSTLQLTQSGGYQVNVPYQVASPTLAGQPLPFAFGPLEGPFAPVIFALGDPINGGLLYYCNFSDADGASDANTLEISTPSSNLVSGSVWNGLCFAGDRDVIFCQRYSYLTTLGVGNSTTYQWNKVPSPSGIWSRWACCTSPIGMAFLGRDGIYIATDNGAVSITDEKLYPLFPHDGNPALPIDSGSNIIYPVDMTRVQNLRLSYCDEALRFCYVDTVGNFVTLIYQIYKKRWFAEVYADDINYHYLVEMPEEGPNQQQILMLNMGSGGNNIMLSGGNTDNGVQINTVVLTPSMDGGDERSQKLYVDSMLQADSTGLTPQVITMAAAFDNAQSFSPVVGFNVFGSIQQYLENISSLADLSLYRNIGAKFAWTGGPDGPRLYAWEPSGFIQPYLSKFFVTQFISLSFPGWKHHRRMYAALISNNPVLLTIKCQNDNTFGPIVIPSTGGQMRILPIMLPQAIKDLAFAYQLDGQGSNFAFFPSDFVIEIKEWSEETYIKLAIFKS